MRRGTSRAGGREPLIVLIKTLQQALRTELEAALGEVGMTLAQLAVLGTLTRIPRLSNAELARAAFVSPQSMGEILAALERGGLIERSPDPTNARILRTTLTTAGAEALSRGGAEAARVEARLVSDLSAEEQRMLRDMLERCIARLGSRSGAAEEDSPSEGRDRRGIRKRAD